MASALSGRAHLSRPGRCLATALLATTLAGCARSGGEALLEDYAGRIARPLDSAIVSPAPPAMATPPRTAAVQIDVAGGSIDGLDFLHLRGCALQTTVARRNSSLGRMAPPSQRLLLELAFLREAPACIDSLHDEGRTELADLLWAARERKVAQLPALIFNATLGSPEYRDLWRADGRLEAYPEGTGSAVITALEQIAANATRWLQGDYAADDAGFELALGTVARGDGGELLLALAYQAAWLEAADDAIDARLSGGALCRSGRVPRSAPILRTVVRKYFVGGVQPWSAAVNQRYHGLLAPIQDLESQLETILPAAYVSWRDARNAQLERDRSAPATHVRRLQALLGPCYAEFAGDGEKTDEQER